MFKILSFFIFGFPLLIIAIIVQVIFAIITAFIAAKKGRSIIAWFFIGLTLGVIGLINIFSASDLKAESKKEKMLYEEINQLRDELMAEQKKNDELREIVLKHAQLHDDEGVIDMD